MALTIDFYISLAIALIMFGIGTSLSTKEFNNQFKAPKAIFLGLILQLLLLPAVALFASSFTNLSDELKMGIFIVSICPGGATSNFISYIVKADTALSVTLTVLNSFLILITIPILLELGLNVYHLTDVDGKLVLGASIFKLLSLLIFPIFLGVLFNSKQPQLCSKIKFPVKVITTILLAVVFGIKFFGATTIGGSGIQTEEILALLGPCISVHFISMIVSYLIARKCRANALQSITIAIEVGLQNTALALLICSALLSSNELSKPALVIALFSFFTTLVFAYLSKKLQNV